MVLKFSTKAGTINSLKTVLKSARIAPLLSFTVKQWDEDRKACLVNLENTLGPEPWIVRSSSGKEDQVETSNAGAFLSILNVRNNNLVSAVEKVIASYYQKENSDELLIQPMLSNVIRSGVAFSHDPNTCAPYRTVNWSESSDTTIVTGGVGGQVWQQAARSSVKPPLKLAPVVKLIEELLRIFNNEPVDCEFAITQESEGEVLWLLQARPLILKLPPESEEKQAARLKSVELKVERGMRPHPFLIGRSTVYGVMPDWNPAEIVGIRPKPLALSLYRDLVTDSIWAYQRHNYGYRNLRSFPLMPNFFGLPYIDVRLSFNSFIPADLDEGLAGRLVDYYIDRLMKEPTLHDKVEFEIVFSCYTLDLPRRLECLSDAGFSRSEREAIAFSLRGITNRIVDSKDGLWRIDASKINTLNERRNILLSSEADPLERIYWLLEDAKRYGTLPFAGLARAGFVAVQMLKSLLAVGVFSQEDYDAFLSGVSSVSSKLASDREKMDKTTFLARYGHLRPGTYDILSPRYDEAPEVYFDWDQKQMHNPNKQFSLTLPQMRAIGKLLEEHSLQIDPVGLLEFMQTGIEMRELAKFHFTNNLSDALALINKFGASYNIKKEDLAYCDIMAFKELYVAANDTKSVILSSIDQGKARYNESLKLVLPPLISKPEDVWAFHWLESAPNFITQKQVTAPISGVDNLEKLAGAIVCIPNADPGFDWLFAYPIAGLITAWGGANSHMAIRAGELSLPAVIGAGEQLYRKWSGARRVHLDCAGRQIEVLA